MSWSSLPENWNRKSLLTSNSITRAIHCPLHYPTCRCSTDPGSWWRERPPAPPDTGTVIPVSPLSAHFPEAIHVPRGGHKRIAGAFLAPVLPPPTLTASPSPLPRRHRVRISPQAFSRLSCFVFLPLQHRIPRRILAYHQDAPALTSSSRSSHADMQSSTRPCPWGFWSSRAVITCAASCSR
jgi:hypothetical protein